MRPAAPLLVTIGVLVAATAALAQAQTAPAEAMPEATLGRDSFPGWKRVPGPMDMAVNAPQRLMDSGQAGIATVFCTAKDGGALTDCRIVREDPPGMGVGDAALRVSRYFRLRPTMPDGSSVAGQTVRFPVRFVPPT